MDFDQELYEQIKTEYFDKLADAIQRGVITQAEVNKAMEKAELYILNEMSRRTDD